MGLSSDYSFSRPRKLVAYGSSFKAGITQVVLLDTEDDSRCQLP
jgi:hypothetical protein